jgi:site-specific DNA recombinase
MRFYEMSGRRCGDLGERCKRSQRLRLDLACRLRCAWTRDPRPYMPKPVQPKNARPIRSESRALLVASIARGRRWLDELITDPAATTESIAGREGCTTRKINMTISLAFLAPDLVKAAIDGRLPHGMGVARLADLSAEWSRQRQMLGLPVL